MEMALDPGIWRRVDALYATRARLTLARRPGAAAGPLASQPAPLRRRAGRRRQRDRLTEISTRLATLHTPSRRTCWHDENDWQMVLGEGDLDGLPDFLVAAAKEAAKERERWRAT